MTNLGRQGQNKQAEKMSATGEHRGSAVQFPTRLMMMMMVMMMTVRVIVVQMKTIRQVSCCVCVCPVVANFCLHSAPPPPSPPFIHVPSTAARLVALAYYPKRRTNQNRKRKLHAH